MPRSVNRNIDNIQIGPRKIFDTTGNLIQIITTGKKFPAHGGGRVAHTEPPVIRNREGGEDPFAVNRMETVNAQTSTNSTATPVVADNPGSKYPFASVSLSDGDLTAIITKVSELKGLLPLMPDLTPTERQRMSKLGNKSRAFADLALETVRVDSGVLPQSVSVDTFVAQDELLRDLSLVQTHVTDLKYKLDDALLLIGNYIFGVSRTVYALMKTPAAQAKLQEQKAAMKLRFAKGKSQTPAK
jgi:hypothetical protein